MEIPILSSWIVRSLQARFWANGSSKTLQSLDPIPSQPGDNGGQAAPDDDRGSGEDRQQTAGRRKRDRLQAKGDGGIRSENSSLEFVRYTCLKDYYLKDIDDCYSNPQDRQYTYGKE